MNISTLTKDQLKKYRKGMQAENRLLTLDFKTVKVPDLLKDGMEKLPVEAYRNKHFLVQIFDEGDDVERISVCRTAIDITNKRWKDGITWDEMQKIKRLVGREDKDAVEVYPKDEDVIDVANMRHLWVFKKVEVPFKWKVKNDQAN